MERRSKETGNLGKMERERESKRGSAPTQHFHFRMRAPDSRATEVGQAPAGSRCTVRRAIKVLPRKRIVWLPAAILQRDLINASRKTNNKEFFFLLITEERSVTVACKNCPRSPSFRSVYSLSFQIDKLRPLPSTLLQSRTGRSLVESPP